jgi:hypothetical protein
LRQTDRLVSHFRCQFSCGALYAVANPASKTRDQCWTVAVSKEMYKAIQFLKSMHIHKLDAQS